jgi:hypothetical protein
MTLTRRRFVPVLGLSTAGVLSPSLFANRYLMNNNESNALQSKIFVVRNYLLKNGTQSARLHQFLKEALVPALKVSGDVPLGIFDAVIAPDMPQVMTIAGFPSFGEWQAGEVKLNESADLTRALANWEQPAEAPYESYSERVLGVTPFSPPLPLLSDAKPRIFELRVYHSPTRRQLAALNDRFSGPEITIFHRCGIFPVLYTNAITGENLPNLTYLTPFESLAAREKAWAAFAADPEWMKVRAESIEKFGQISSVMHISLWKATDYSPLK